MARIHEQTTDTAGGLQELACVVVTTEALTIEGETVSPGTEGVIVGTWAGGKAYSVEFFDPVGVATVEASDLRLA